MEPGLDRFINHLDTLASYYNPGEESLYAQAVGFIWGGVPLGDPTAAAWQMGTDPQAAWAQYRILFEGTANWRPSLVDDKNPSHHYAGLFFMGYFFGTSIGRSVNWFRDGPLSSSNEADLITGDIASDHGHMLFADIISLSEVGSIARYALDARPGLWSSNTPGKRTQLWNYYPSNRY